MSIVHFLDSSKSPFSLGNVEYRSTKTFTRAEMNNDLYLKEVRRIICNNMDAKSWINALHVLSFKATFEKKVDLIM